MAICLCSLDDDEGLLYPSRRNVNLDSLSFLTKTEYEICMFSRILTLFFYFFFVLSLSI